MCVSAGLWKRIGTRAWERAHRNARIGTREPQGSATHPAAAIVVVEPLLILAPPVGALVVQRVDARTECGQAGGRPLRGDGGRVLLEAHDGRFAELAAGDRTELLERRADGVLVDALLEVPQAYRPVVLFGSQWDLLELQDARADGRRVQIL